MQGVGGGRAAGGRALGPAGAMCHTATPVSGLSRPDSSFCKQTQGLGDAVGVSPCPLSLSDPFQAQKGTPIALSSPHQDPPHPPGASRQGLLIVVFYVRPELGRAGSCFHAALGHGVPHVSTTPSPKPWRGSWRRVQTLGRASPPFSTWAMGSEIARLGQDFLSPASLACGSSPGQDPLESAPCRPGWP